VLLTLSITTREAMLLFGLFWAQFIVGGLVPESWHAAERVGVGIVYLVLGLGIIMRHRGLVAPLIRDGFRTSYPVLSGAQPPDE